MVDQEIFEYEGCHECWFCKSDQLSGYPVCVFPGDCCDAIVEDYMAKTAPKDCPIRNGVSFRLREEE